MELEEKKALLTKELVELYYFFMHQMLKEKKIKRIQTYADWFYSIDGNCINPTLVDNCRILKQNVEDFSLKNKKLIERVENLYFQSLKIKDELYKLSPIYRGTSVNKDFAKMFAGKHREVFDKKYNQAIGR